MHAEKLHTYQTDLTWTGNDGTGTAAYQGYRRDHTLASDGKPQIPGSSDPAFRGNPSRYNPEELLVASLSACHMLTYLHLCAKHHITVTAYEDKASGVMRENADGSGEFVEVTLHPMVTISATDDAGLANRLHDDAHALCFIARSVRFAVHHQPHTVRAGA